jgi:hypothetical protein
MLFMMGLFAIYNGTIYNDCMSIPVALYQTPYTFVPDPDHAGMETAIRTESFHYPFGLFLCSLSFPSSSLFCVCVFSFLFLLLLPSSHPSLPFSLLLSSLPFFFLSLQVLTRPGTTHKINYNL